MDEATFRERVKRIQEIDKAISKLDPAIRSQAFALLQDYAGARSVTGRHEEASEDEEEANGGDAAAFFAKIEHSKPKDNAVALAAYHYKQYGTAPFSTEEIKTLADEVGLTIPSRLDMTFKGSRRNGKSLFRAIGTGKFSPTVKGEEHFKETYKIKKGKKPKPAETALT